MIETITIRHPSVNGTFEGTITGEFTGKNPARDRDAFLASLRACGWKINGEPDTVDLAPPPRAPRTRLKQATRKGVRR